VIRRTNYQLLSFALVFLLNISGLVPQLAVAEAKPMRVVILGDSLTAGYGLSEELAYPALIEAALREKGYSVRIDNAGVSGDTTAGGLNRLGWLLKKPVDVLVVALGANDALRGLPVTQAKHNLAQIIRTARAEYPSIQILLTGMKAPPSMGASYVNRFDSIFPDLAKEEQVRLVPFLLEGVAGERALNLPDRLHPNEEGQKRISSTLLPELEGLLSATAQ